jgi:hypothetical protein
MGLFASIFFSNTFSISVQLQIEEISRKLRTGDLGIPVTEERFAIPFNLRFSIAAVGWSLNNSKNYNALSNTLKLTIILS